MDASDRSSLPESIEDPPTVAVSPGASASAPAELSAPAAGSTVGRYVVLEVIGRGGMGTVVRAYDPKLRREVALKQLRSDVLDAEGEARLVREAQAMAQLSHPNVVAVYDVDVEGADVTVAMEYVGGQTLRTWLAAENRSWSEILSRFWQAGQGLVAAHAVELVHRDFKPSNVLIGEDGRARVTDFGLAKATGSGSAEGSRSPDAPSFTDDDGLTSPLTRLDTVMGTPRYMAPEQHAGRAAEATADQYAFCVALWEALHGEAPFRGKDLVAAKEQGPPRWTNATVPRSIAAAIERGMSPRVEDRWPSMVELLGALEVRPPRRWPLTLGVLGVGGVLTAVAFAKAQGSKPCSGGADQIAPTWNDERRQAVASAFRGASTPLADDTWTRVAPTLDAYAVEWTEHHHEACAATTIRGEQSASMMDLRMACLHRAQQELEATVAVLGEADADVVHKAGKIVRGLPPLSGCEDLEALSADVPPPDDDETRARVDEARAELARARSEHRAGKFDEALVRLQAASMLAAADAYAPFRYERMHLLGRTFEQQGHYDEAETLLSDALTLALELGMERAAASSAASYATLLATHQGRHDQALPVARIALALARQTDAGGRTESVALDAVGDVHRIAGRSAEAERSVRKALEIDARVRPDDVARESSLRASLALAIEAQGRIDEAVAEHRRVVALAEQTYGSRHPSVASAKNNLAVLLRKIGHYEESEVLHREVVESMEAVHGSGHPITIGTRDNLAAVWMDLGRHEDAIEALRKALEDFEAALGPDHYRVGATANNLGLALAHVERYEESVEYYRRAIANWEKNLGPDHLDVAIARSNLAGALERLGRRDDAEALYREVLIAREEKLDADNPSVATSLQNLASLLVHDERYQEALPLLERAWKIRSETPTAPYRLGGTAFFLAQTLWALGRDRDRAIELGHRAKAAFAERGGPGTEAKLAEVEAWLKSRSAAR